MKRMNKVLLAVVACATVFAASAKTKSTHSVSTSHLRTLNRTTATGDTVMLMNVTAADTPTLYLAGTNTDSGFVAGIDAYGDKGYAERYDFGTSDSSLKIIGVMTLFGGRYSPTTTKTVSLNCWSMAPQSATAFTNVYNSGLPDASLASLTVPVPQLGIRSTSSVSDTFKTFLFPTPTAYLNQSFFVGYTINYDATDFGGDTLGLYQSRDGARTSDLYTISGTDTIINNQNVTMYDDGNWYDNALDNFFLSNDFFIFPIAIVRETTGIHGLTKNNLTFYGAAPNPAANATSIKIAIMKGTDVAVTVFDMSGKCLITQNFNHLQAGEQKLEINTSNLVNGSYLYLVKTSEGDGIASKLEVAK